MDLTKPYHYLLLVKEPLFQCVDNKTVAKYYELCDRGGEKLQKEAEELAKKRTSRPKPGKLCFVTCWIDDGRCQECLNRQNAVYDALLELQQLEEVLANPELMNAKKFTKCLVCGAPYELGESACPYCGKEYPEGIVTVDLPKSVDELRRLIRRKAYDAWKPYPEVMLKMVERMMNDAKDAGDILTQVPFAMLRDNIIPGYTMTLEQIERGADLNAMSLSGYLLAVIRGQVDCEATKEFRAKQEEQQRLRKEQQQRQHDLNMQRLEQQRRSDDYRIGLMANRLNSSTPKYNGGSARTCYDCEYYSAGAGRCASTGNRTTAGNSCGRFKLK